MTRPPVMLDLFCGAGGAAVGYAMAGFRVVGVDIRPQPHYPFEFVQGDALAYAREHAAGFDAVHASPPCQGYSDLGHHNGRDRDYLGTPQLLGATRVVLRRSRRPYIIENVEGAPMQGNVIRLCGTMFPGLRVLRHRLFEGGNGVALQGLPHPKQHPLVRCHDARKAHYLALDEWSSYVQVTGGGNTTVAAAADAMLIDWKMTKPELNQAIPPAYTEFLGRQLIVQLP